MPADTHTTQPPQLGVAGSSWLHLGAWDMPQGEPRGAKEDLYSGLTYIYKCIGASGVHALKLLEEVFGVSWECLGAPRGLEPGPRPDLNTIVSGDSCLGAFSLVPQGILTGLLFIGRSWDGGILTGLIFIGRSWDLE